jgi:excisionase family DNA binding protein
MQAQQYITMNRTPKQAIAPLLISGREAAKLLSVCEKTLWTLTKAGEIPAVHIGRAVRYSMEDLRTWIASRSEKKCALGQNCS